ncbi:MAG: ribonuclease III [Bacilli bacterium]
MKKLLDELGIKYNSVDIYNTALTHPSYAHENNLGKSHNQRLEFLGDAIFDLILSEFLYNNYCYSEGEMTKLRAMYVCEKALCLYAKKIGLENFIKLGKGEKSNLKDAVIADAFEAFVAAIYLDLGLAEVEKFFDRYISEIIVSKKFNFEDYKSKLQELVQSDKRTLEYKLVKQDGPSHQPTFYIDVYMDDILLGSGIGHSKKNAEQDAAKVALNKMVASGGSHVFKED